MLACFSPGFEWNWEKEGSGSTVVFQNNDRNVIFNPGFSVGTAAVRGTKPFRPGYHHYWEIEMSTEVYGTDMVRLYLFPVPIRKIHLKDQ